MSIIDELRASGIAMGTVYANGLHVGWTTDEAKMRRAQELGAHVSFGGGTVTPGWEIRAIEREDVSPTEGMEQS